MNDGTKRPKAQDQDHTNPFEEWERSNLRGKQRKRAAPKVDADGPKLPLLSLNEPAPGADPDPAVVGKIKESVSRDPKGLQRALEGLGLSLRYNLRGATAEWRGHDLPGKHDGAWNAVNDRFDSFVREQIATSFVMEWRGCDPISTPTARNCGPRRWPCTGPGPTRSAYRPSSDPRKRK